MDVIFPFDPSPQGADPIQDIRPTTNDIIQLEMLRLGSYTIYAFPEIMRDFEDVDIMKANIFALIFERVGDPAAPMLQLKWDIEELIERGLAVMANYKIANLDLRRWTAYKVFPKPPKGQKRSMRPLHGQWTGPETFR